MSDLKLQLVVKAVTGDAVTALNTLNAAIKSSGQTSQAGAAQASSAVNQLGADWQRTAGGIIVPANQQASAAIKQQVAALQEAVTATKAMGTAASSAVPDIRHAAEAHTQLGQATVATRRELLVLAHEMSQGNYSRFGGSLLVLAEHAQGLGDIVASLGSILGFIVNPITIAAGAVLGLGFAALQASEDAHAFKQALIEGGGIAGLTAGQYREAAERIGEASHEHFGAAREALNGLIASGRFTAESIEPVSQAIVRVADITGEETEKVVADFAKMADGVAKWAEEHNKQYHFLTLAQYDHIKALEDEGNAQAAAAEVGRLLNESLQTQAQHLGYLPGFWANLTGAIRDAWQAAKDFGADDTLEQKIDKLRAKIEAANNLTGPFGQAGLFADVAGLGGFGSHANPADVAELARLQNEKQAADEKAAAESKKKLHDQQQIEARNFFDGMARSYHLGGEQLAKEIAEINRKADLLKGTPDAISDQQRASLIQAVKDRYNGGLSTPLRNENYLLAKANDSGVLQARKAEDDAEKAQLDRKLQAFQISYADYYARLSEMRQAEAELEQKVIDDEIAGARADLANATDPNARVRIQAQLIDLGNRKKAVEEAATAATAANSAKAGEALDKLQAKLDAIVAKSQDLQALAPADRLAAVADQTASRLKPELDAQRANGADAGVVERILQTETAKAQLADIKAQLDDIAGKYQNGVATLNAQQQLGSISPSEARQAVAGLRQDAQEAIDQVEQAGATISGYVGSRVASDVTKVRAVVSVEKNQVQQLADAWADYQTQFQGVAVKSFNGASQALADFVTKGKADFKGLADSIINDLVRISIQKALTGEGGGGGGGGIFGALLSIGASAASAYFGGGAAGGAVDLGTGAGAGLSSGLQLSDSATSSAGLIFRANGGPVPGIGSGDTQPAMLTPGEFVLKVDAVRRLGVPFLNALNEGQPVKAFAAGGLVTGSAAAATSAAAANGSRSITVNLGGIDARGATDTTAIVRAGQVLEANLTRKLSEMIKRGTL